MDTETTKQVEWFAAHSTPAHIHGWNTPSGHTIHPSECPPCRENDHVRS